MNSSLWAWEALEHYSENYCGDELDRAQNRFHNLESAKHRARIANELAKYQQECHQDYLEVFTDKVTIKLLTIIIQTRI